MQRVTPHLGANDIFSYWEIYTLDDTLIQNKVYRKVATKNLCHLTPDLSGKLHNSTTLNTNEFVFGGIREENKKVYFLRFNQAPQWGTLQYKGMNFNPDEEYLLYDFDVMPGDTIQFGEVRFVSIVNGDTTYTTRQYSTIIRKELTSEQNHKRYEVTNSHVFAPPHETGILMEGIGSSYGFFGVYDSYLTYLMCFELDGESLIYSYKCNPCAQYVSTENADEDLLLSLYPNPTNSRIEISSNSNTKIKEVKILDSVGKWLSARSYSSERITLDLSDYAAGIFFLRITLDNGKVLVKKVVLVN